jgi:hypothetical protein
MVDAMPRPFVFMTSIQAVQLTGLRAQNLAELHAGLTQVDGSSIYHHTYRFLRLLHFLQDVPHSDFAYWIGENLKEEIIAEQIAALDLRDFSSLRDLRTVLLSIIVKAREDAHRWERSVPPGLEFHFCRSTSIVISTGHEAQTLEDFIAGLGRIDVGSLFYHLVEAPLHQAEGSLIQANDFSSWLEGTLGLGEEAHAIARLNPYTWDMETLRGKIIELLGRGKLRSVVEKVLRHQPESETSAVLRALLQKWRGQPSVSPEEQTSFGSKE